MYDTFRELEQAGEGEENDARIHSGNYRHDRGDCRRGAFRPGDWAREHARRRAAVIAGNKGCGARHGRQRRAECAEHYESSTADGAEPCRWRGNLLVQMRAMTPFS